MKRSSFLRHLRKHGCYLKREDREHSLWCNPNTGEVEAVPRHTEIPNKLARKICRGLSIPEIQAEIVLNRLTKIEEIRIECLSKARKAIYERSR